MPGIIRGPRPLSEAPALKGKAGVYLLSRDGRKVEYVGRADTDIALDIRTGANRFSGIQFFWYEVCPSPEVAHQRECELYHHYDERSPLLNAHHPAAPEGEDWPCPVPGCPLGDRRAAVPSPGTL